MRPFHAMQLRHRRRFSVILRIVIGSGCLEIFSKICGYMHRLHVLKSKSVILCKMREPLDQGSIQRIAVLVSVETADVPAATDIAKGSPV